MLDLSTLDVVAAADTAVRTELEHPSTGEVMRDADGVAYYVEHFGEDSTAVRAVDRRHQNQRAERLRKNRDLQLDQDTLERESVERLVAATHTWYLPPMRGETLECTPENARRLYGNPGMAWIPEQIGKAMKDRRRFFSPLSTP